MKRNYVFLQMTELFARESIGSNDNDRVVRDVHLILKSTQTQVRMSAIREQNNLNFVDFFLTALSPVQQSLTTALTA
jgi:hypothetical protein